MARGSSVGPGGGGGALTGARRGQCRPPQTKALPPHQGSKQCLQKQPMTMTCTHTQFNVAWAPCPPPTDWVARALSGCSSSSGSSGRRQNVPLRTEKGDPAE